MSDGFSNAIVWSVVNRLKLKSSINCDSDDDGGGAVEGQVT